MTPNAPSAPQPAGAAWSDRGDVAPPNPTGEQLARLIRRGIGLRKFEPPALPHTAARILALAGDADVDMKALARLVEQDVMLSARILRLMQSPLYSRGIKITSIEQAVTRLGLSMLRSVVAEAGLDAVVFSSEGYADSMEQLRIHSSATAQLTPLVSRVAGVRRDDAFLAGLFHDIGIAASLLLVAEAYAGDPPSLADAWGDIIWLHEQVGHRISQAWRLPEELSAVCRHHHKPSETAKDPVGSAIVCVSDWLATECGAGNSVLELESAAARLSEGVTTDEDLRAACAALGSTVEAMEGLVPEALDIVAQLSSEVD
jgi:HD-like signal output (HDOD) protein